MAALRRPRSEQAPRTAPVGRPQSEPHRRAPFNVRPATRFLIAALSGLALAFAFPSHHWPVLAWGSVAGLILASQQPNLRIAASCGFFYGAVFTTVTLPWTYTVMRAHGGLPALSAVGVLALMNAVLSLYPAAFALGVAWLGRRSLALACLAAPFLWVALEFGQTHMPHIGFPWNLLGYAGAGNPALVQLTTWTGIYGLSFIVAAYNALLVFALGDWARDGKHSALLAILVLSVMLIVTAYFGEALVPHQPPQHTARLVQTNFPQSLSYPPDWFERHAGEMDELERLSLAAPQHGAELVIWPETPAPFSLENAWFATRAERIARGLPAGLLAGEVEWRPSPQGSLLPYNSAALLDSAGRRVFVYDKIHLVPFGEYVPLRRYLTFAKKLTAEVGDFEAGTEYRIGALPVGAHSGGRFGVFICYEAIFPNEVRRFVAGGANLLVNLSNDGWFGRSAAPEQHLMMARVRAVENRRWLLRCTNNGLTVSLDPYGRIVARMAAGVRGSLEAPYGFRSDLTFYARHGDWVAWLCVAASGLLLILGARRGPRRA